MLARGARLGICGVSINPLDEKDRTEPITKAVGEVLKAVEKPIPPHEWTLLMPGSKQHDVMDAVHNLRKLLETGER